MHSCGCWLLDNDGSFEYHGGVNMTITTKDGKECDGLDQAPFEPIAVIGMAALMPDATSIEEFWQNIIDAHVSIKEVPSHRWDPEIYWEQSGPGKVTEGKTYSKIGGFVEEFEFDWRRWRQPPGSIPQIDPCQLWAVTVSADALDDAGYGEGGKVLDRARTGVVFANALGGENRSESNLRVFSQEMRKIAIDNGVTPEQADAMVEKICEGKPRINEDTMPGELANVVSGRVANLLDLQDQITQQMQHAHLQWPHYSMLADYCKIDKLTQC